MDLLSIAVGALPALAGGLIQGVTGFGAGVVMMMFLPLVFDVSRAAGISSAICFAVTVSMAWRYRAHVNIREIVGPAVLYLATSSASIVVAQGIDQSLMKIVLGAFLILLAGYSLFFQRGGTFRPEGLVAIACIIISGMCDGLFGIGGPLMVVYFMARTASTKEYLGTLQCFLLVNVVYSTAFRLANGVITAADAPVVAAGMVSILLGLAIANRIVDRLDADRVRVLTYAVIGLSGVSTIAGVLI